MFLFTLTGSRTRVDTVQSVSDGVTSWSHIYWSHTVKELGSRVTFVRSGSVRKVILRDTYSDMKVWNRMFAMTVQSVSVQHLNWVLRPHQVVHSDVKKFCCGFCGKYFKLQQRVKRHVRRCPDVGGFDDMLWGCFGAFFVGLVEMILTSLFFRFSYIFLFGWISLRFDTAKYVLSHCWRDRLL